MLTTVSPEVGGVLVRGEKGTAKTTTVRALAAVLPELAVVEGCRFGCDPDEVDPTCPDGPHEHPVRTSRPARLVELPVGATEDRVIGSLDLRQALGAGEVVYSPGLLAAAHRGLLYVDEVNLLHDHLVDLLLDAAATGRSTVEREGVSIAHASRLVLVGTMNPEEGELRPQLLDRFGLTVEVAAPTEPELRAEVVRRRMAYDADPETFAATWADAETALRARLADAQRAGRFGGAGRRRAAADRPGLRGVRGRRAPRRPRDRPGRRRPRGLARPDRVTKADIRAAARLALPHRRRRNPFDAPGLDEDLLDALLGDDDPPAAGGAATGHPARRLRGHRRRRRTRRRAGRGPAAHPARTGRRSERRERSAAGARDRAVDRPGRAGRARPADAARRPPRSRSRRRARPTAPGSSPPAVSGRGRPVGAAAP